MSKKKYTVIALVLGIIIILITGFNFFGSGFGFFNSANENEHGRFVRVGDMHYARPEHKAVLLHDGQVLIVGGVSESEIYTPKKRKFKLIGKKLKQHGVFTVTLLNDGKVLIVGWTKETELFDPKSEIFKLSGNLNYPRHYHTATLLKDGRVLIAGGRLVHPDRNNDINHSWYFTEYSEIYDPKTGKFELGPKLNAPRFKHDAILLNDGNVLIVGGAGEKERLRSAEIYDVSTNKFIQINDMNHIRVRPQLIKLKNGKILVVSGYGYPPNWSEAKDIKGPGKYGWAKLIEIYDPGKRTFENFVENDLTAPTSRVTLLKNENILLTGGDIKYRWYYVDTKASAILNPETKEMVRGPELREKRGGGTTTLLNDGTVLIISGKTAELYIPDDSNK